MSIKPKKGGIYVDPTAIFVKKNGAYGVAIGLSPKVFGVYKNALSLLKFASNRTQFPAGIGVIGTAGTLWQADKITLQAPDDWDATAPIFTFPGFSCSRGASTDEVALTNDLVIRNASIFINGVFVKMLTFGGNAGVTIPANSATPWAQNDRDPSIVIPRGAEYSVVVQTNIAAGQYRLTTYYAGPKDGNVTSGVSNRDAYVNGTTAFPAPSIGAQMYGPCAVVAEGWATGCKPVPLIVGDSIGFGKNDDNALLATEQVFGYVNRAMIDTNGPGRYSYGNFCVPGTRLDGLSDARFGWRKAILQSLGMPFTCVYVEMGINTPTASRVPDWESIAGPFLQAMAGTKDIIGGTLLPQSAILNNSSGTDYVNQTALNNDVWNNYVKAAGGGVTKFFTKFVDNTPAFVDAGNPGKWIVPSYSTTLAVALTGASSTDFIVNNPAPAVDDALVLNPGQASKTTKMVKSVVDLGDGTSRVSTYFAFAATMAVGTPVKATNSEDGTHPTSQISKSGKAPLVAAKAAGIFT